MKIKQISLLNIGPYKGENRFSFNTGDANENIVLIGGKNGAGKTTLFEAMRLCLYGYKVFGYQKNSSVYTSIVKKLINDDVKRMGSADASVTMTMLIEDGFSSQVFTIIRNWNLQGNQLKETYHVYKNDVLLNDEELIDFDSYILHTIPPALFKFHFFNGEKISEFLFDDINGKSFKQAFLQLCGLDTLDLIQEQFQAHISKNNSGEKTNAQKIYIEKKEFYEKLFAQAENLDKEILEIQMSISRLEEVKTKLDDDMLQYGGVQVQEWNVIQEQLNVEEGYRNEQRRQLRDVTNNVLPFVILGEELEKLRRQICVEDCISSNRIIKEKLLKNSTKEEFGEGLLLKLYEAIKDDIDENSMEILKLSEKEKIDIQAKINYYQNFDVNIISDYVKNINISAEKTKRLRMNFDSKERIDSHEYLSKKNDILTQIDEFRIALLDVKAQRLQLDEGLNVSRAERDKTYAVFRATLKEQSIKDISARAILAFDELKQNLYRKYITIVEEEFIQRFNKLISKKDLLDGIYISDNFEVIAYKNSDMDMAQAGWLLEVFGVTYINDNFGERALKTIQEDASQEGVLSLPIKIDQHFSAGERQIFIMALYQALAVIRTSDIPFVIDTPLARIDKEHRKNILTNFFSDLPGQVIVLSTDEEIDDECVGFIQQKISNLYLIEHEPDGSTRIKQNQYFKKEV